MSERKYPAYMYLPSYNGKRLPDEYFESTPVELQHIKKMRPEYNMASTGEREKAPIRRRAPKAKKEFSTAHEGPREVVGKPETKFIYTPLGKVAYEVHAKHDREAVLRNRKRDRQMKQWREARRSKSRIFNTRAMAPQHLREQQIPQVFSQQNRGRHAAERENLDRSH